MTKKALILVNLGTPATPRVKDVEAYLKEFFSDAQILPFPSLVRSLLSKLIAKRRAPHSANLYESIWLKTGSPLKVYTASLAEKLNQKLSNENRCRVVYAMRYGEPSLKTAYAQLLSEGVNDVYILSLYPQYSSATQGSLAAYVKANGIAAKILPEYYNHPAYIEAIRNSIVANWQKHQRGDKLIFSFHSLPTSPKAKSGPYIGQCYETANLVALTLGLEQKDYEVTFQSQINSSWIGPFTDEVIAKEAQEKLKIDVVCPGFAVDCLETLEEIDKRYRAKFTAAGGEVFHYIPALNDTPEHVMLLSALVLF